MILIKANTSPNTFLLVCVYTVCVYVCVPTVKWFALSEDLKTLLCFHLCRSLKEIQQGRTEDFLSEFPQSCRRQIK